jgi:4-hydroxy-tetrahydrodipicolinate synthase
MRQSQVEGVYAALLTPRDAGGDIDLPGLAGLVQFLVGRGIRSYALNGATGEFCLTSPQELKRLFAAIREVTEDQVEIVCGVGAAGIREAIELARIAQEEGASALLAPAPYFFRYEQDDLEAYFESLASSVSLPLLLYNLPQFTTGIEVETACRLIRNVENISGIKDSSGSLEIVRSLTERGIPARRIIGNDGALVAALKENVCDGVISGVACVLPELIRAIYSAGSEQERSGGNKAADLLSEFIRQIDVFPTPWGLKWIAEARGVLGANFAQPLSPRRRVQSEALQSWFSEWQSGLPIDSRST